MLKLDPYFANNMDDERPIVAMDIDGVLNYLGTNKPGYTLNRYGVLGYPIRVRTDIEAVLEPLLQAQDDGRIVMAWGTMWEDHARTFASEALMGIGVDWPIIYFRTEEETPAEEEISQEALDERLAYQNEMHLDRYSRVCFKTPPIWDFARRVKRRVIWFDDMVSGNDRNWLKERENEYLFPVRVQEHLGLTKAQVLNALDLLVPTRA